MRLYQSCIARARHGVCSVTGGGVAGCADCVDIVIYNTPSKKNNLPSLANQFYVYIIEPIFDMWL